METTQFQAGAWQMRWKKMGGGGDQTKPPRLPGEVMFLKGRRTQTFVFSKEGQQKCNAS